MTEPVVHKRPVRIYLDQKDFGRIADAIRQWGQQSADFVAYDQLRRYVAAGKVHVYFSFVHLVEAFRFGNPRSDVAVAYCDAVDTLTQGNCIRFPEYLQQAELNLALAEIVGSAPNHSKASYPYGKHAEAVTTDGLPPDPTLIDLLREATVTSIEEMRITLMKSLPNGLPIQAFLDAIPLADSAQLESLCGMKGKEVLTILLTGSAEQRQSLATSLLNNPDYLRQAFAAFPDDALEQFNARFPSREFRWTRELLTTFISGSSDERSQLSRRFLDGVMSFKQLMTYYRLTVPE